MLPSYTIGVVAYEVKPLYRSPESTRLIINNKTVNCDIQWEDQHKAVLSVDGVNHRMFTAQDGDKLYIQIDGRMHVVSIHNDFSSGAGAASDPTNISAPMPGAVLVVNAAVGQKVVAGDVLLIIESMKMQMELKAEIDGEIAVVNVEKGSTFDRGDILIELTAEPASEPSAEPSAEPTTEAGAA